MNKNILLFTLLFTSLLLAASASAPLNGRLSLGYVSTTGNTDESKLNFDFNLNQKRSEKLKLEYSGLFNYGKANGITNTDKKNINVLGEFVKDSKRSYYANIGLLQDEFAGYENQRIIGLGHIWNVIQSKDVNFRLLAGMEFTHDEYTDNTAKDLKWIKVGYKADKQIAENIKLISGLDVVSPKFNISKEYQADFSLGGIFTVNTQFDLETKYSLSYISDPVVAGKKKADTVFYTNLVYKL